jgi:hypothetical protein
MKTTKPEPAQNRRVFHLSTPKDLFLKLDWELDNFRDVISGQPRTHLTHELAAYHVYNTAVTAWHLTDWTWNSLAEESQKQLANNFGFNMTNKSSENLKFFQQSLRKKSRALGICWEIANGSKHFENHKNSKINAKTEWKAKIATAGEFRAGQPLQAFSYDFVVHWNNQNFRAIDIFEEAKEFWLQFLNQIGFLEDVFVKFEITVEKTNKNGFKNECDSIQGQS